MRSLAHKTFSIECVYWDDVNEKKILATISHLSIFDLLFTIFTFYIRAPIVRWSRVFLVSWDFWVWFRFVATVCVCARRHFHFADIFSSGFSCAVFTVTVHLRIFGLFRFQNETTFFVWFSVFRCGFFFLFLSLFTYANRFHSLYEMAFVDGVHHQWKVLYSTSYQCHQYETKQNKKKF